MFRRLAAEVRRQWIALAIACVALLVALGGLSTAATIADRFGGGDNKIAAVEAQDFRGIARAQLRNAGLSREEPSTTRAAGGREPVLGYNRWKWFKNTYWIVPQNGIYSIYHNAKDPSRFNVVKGQTVFHITDYFNGYWTGAVVVKLSRALVPSCQFVLGEVTPEGRVYMTMYGASTGEVTNTPVGAMVRKNHKWTMVNQMTGPAESGTLSHWAYMVQSTPQDRTWNHLPFANQSIPKFLSDCPDGPKISNP